jgi:hypothetical protein
LTKRTKIPLNIEADVLFKSDRECCVCDKPGDHIHQIDGKPDNNKFDNLAYLCFHCHHEASVKGGLKKKLTPLVITQYRDLKIRKVETKRKNALKVFSDPITRLNTDKLLEASKTAAIILEIDKIKQRFYEAKDDKRSEILDELNLYVNHKNYTIISYITSLLSLGVIYGRRAKTWQLQASIYSLAIVYFPHEEVGNNKKTREIVRQYCYIAHDICYDAFLYVKTITSAMYGLNLLKFLYREGKLRKLPFIQEKVNETYTQLEAVLQRTDRGNLDDFIQLTAIFKEDLTISSLTFPPFPAALEKKYRDEEDLA